jgi:MFS family permease
MVSRKMLSLYAFSAYGGLVVTYFCGVVPILIKDKLTNAGIVDRIYINKQTAIVMIFFGLSNAFGGFLFGKITRSMGNKFGMLIIFLAGVFAVACTYITQYFVMFVSRC